MIIVAGLVVIARIVVRLRTGVMLQADDYTIAASLVVERRNAHKCFD